ncbi:unnamed protein product, partial [Choristocarpus tenellus]
KEPWSLRAHPELGFLTAVSLGTEKSWLVVGTSRGFVMLWDIRFQVMVRLWRHSSRGPVHKLATCSRLPPQDNSLGPHVIVAAGQNQAAIWDLSVGGSCKQCFRVCSPGDPPLDALNGLELPMLEEIPLPLHPNAPALSPGGQLAAVFEFAGGVSEASSQPAIRALVGRVSRSDRDSYLITGGEDRCIRYWDFQAASRCYTVSGHTSAPTRSTAQLLMVPSLTPGRSSSRVVLFHEHDMDASSATTKAQDLPLAQVQEKGLVPPRSGHDDAVLDVKITELPIKMVLSGSRDGVVKIWR